MRRDVPQIGRLVGRVPVRELPQALYVGLFDAAPFLQPVSARIQSQSGPTHLQPVGNVRVELADMSHAIIEDIDGLRGRQCVLQRVSGCTGEGAVLSPCHRTSRAGYSLRWRSMAIAERGGGRHEDATQRLFIELACCELRGSAAELSRLRTALSGSGSDATGPLQALRARRRLPPGLTSRTGLRSRRIDTLESWGAGNDLRTGSSWPPGVTALLWVSRRAQG